jgi:glycosyltransferase involved in cell wall biosynthesis
MAMLPDVRDAGDHPLRIALVGALVAGVETHFNNLSRVAGAQPFLQPVSVPVRPYRVDMLERFGWMMPPNIRGTLRSVAGTAPLFKLRGLDAVWSQLDLPLLPWMLMWNAGRRIPVIYTADSTPVLARGFAGHYGDWAGGSPLKRRLRDHLHGLFLRRCAAVNAWTQWAARSMREDYGVDPSRLHVIPPGVDTSLWDMPKPRPIPSRPVRILFVGGDFQRKGGDLLVEVYRQQLRNVAEIDFVTRSDAITPEPGLRVHAGLGPNDPRLIRLYADADIFVLPTRADCFSMAGMEAMAAGLPVITCPVGGVGELFTDGEHGIFVPPDDGHALGEAVSALVSNEHRRLAMGAAAQALARFRYDIEANTLRLFALLESAQAIAA